MIPDVETNQFRGKHPEKGGEKTMIYLDYAANHPVDPAVLSRFCAVEMDYPGNPNSSHLAGQAARELLAETTEHIASLLGAKPTEVLYTSGATEANNLALKGIARANRHLGKHILSTQLEHASVGGSLTALQQQGYEIDLLDIRRDGTIDTDQLRELLRSDTILLAVTAVDSELGTIQPLEKIRGILKDYPNCRLHVDATQAVGRIPITFQGFDTMSLAFHKIGGLNGSGLLLKRQQLVIEPLFHGGSSDSIYRSGTPTLALAAAADTALTLAIEYRDERTAVVRDMRTQLETALSAFPKVRINSPAGGVPHILNLSVQGVKGTQFQKALSERGVCVSVKSACSSDGLPSKAVFAVSWERKNALSSWRISLSWRTAQEDITGFLQAFDACYQELA